MKATSKLLFTILWFVLLINSHGIAQDKYSKQQINFGIDGCFLQEVTLKSVNLQLTLFPEEKFSFHYSIGFGTANNMFYAHYPLTGFWGAYLLGSLNSSDADFVTTIAVLSLIIPESVSYNIKIDDKMKISPYVSFNSHEFYYDDKQEAKLKASIGFGSRVSYKITSRFGFTFSTGVKFLYAEGMGLHTTGSIFY